MKLISAAEAASLLAGAEKVAIVPGFGMAASGAQFMVRALTDVLRNRGTLVFFIIHPVAGRMPGHMDMVLDQAGIPHNLFMDVEEANMNLSDVDVLITVGANDIVNPAARNRDSVLYGIPVIDTGSAASILSLKRGEGKGFAGVENGLFGMKKTSVLRGDALESLSDLVEALYRI